MKAERDLGPGARTAFERVLQRAPDAQEEAILWRLRDALGIEPTDALWTVIIALRWHLDLYKAIPAEVNAAAATVRAEIEASADKIAALIPQLREALAAGMNDAVEPAARTLLSQVSTEVGALEQTARAWKNDLAHKSADVARATDALVATAARLERSVNAHQATAATNVAQIGKQIGEAAVATALASSRKAETRAWVFAGVIIAVVVGLAFWFDGRAYATGYATGMNDRPSAVQSWQHTAAHRSGGKAHK